MLKVSLLDERVEKIKKLIPVCTSIAVALGRYACSPQVPSLVQISCDDFCELQHISQEVEVAAGDQLVSEARASWTRFGSWQTYPKTSEVLTQ